ncbi:hypothetical protein ACFX13_048105 [Malus domestica]
MGGFSAMGGSDTPVASMLPGQLKLQPPREALELFQRLQLLKNTHYASEGVPKNAAVVDPVEPEKVLKAAQEHGVNIKLILTTRHYCNEFMNGTAFGNMVVHEEVLRVIQTFRAPPLTFLSVSSSFLSLQVANVAESVELHTTLNILPFRNKVLLPSVIIRIRCTSPNRQWMRDVENVKALLEVEVENVKTLLEVERQQLLYNGREVRNSEMLSALGVRDEDFIMFVSNASSRYT